MKFLILFLGALSLNGQSVSPFAAPPATANPATCSVGSFYINTSTNQIAFCGPINTWNTLLTTATITGLPIFDSASYTGGSSTCGIAEANTAASNAGGGIIFVPAGTCNISAPLKISSYNTLMGASPTGTIIRVANGTFNASTWNVADDHSIMMIGATSSTNVTFTNFTFDENGVNQTAITFGIESSALTLSNTSYSVVSNVRFIGSYDGKRAGSIISAIDSIQSGGNTGGNTHNNLIEHNYVVATATCAGRGVGAVFVDGDFNIIRDNYSVNTCDAAYVANSYGYGNSFSDNTVIAGVLPAVGFQSEFASGTVFHGNHAKGALSQAFYVSNPGSSIVNNTQRNNVVNGNDISDCVIGVQVDNGGTGNINTDTVISNNVITRCTGTAILAQDNVSYVNIVGNVVYSNTNGIVILAYGSGSIPDHISIKSNTVFHNTNSGQFLGGVTLYSTVPGGTGTLPTNVSIVGNDSSDSGSPVQQWGIDVYNGNTISGLTIEGNHTTGNVVGGINLAIPPSSMTNAIIQGNNSTIYTNGTLVGNYDYGPQCLYANLANLPIGSTCYCTNCAIFGTNTCVGGGGGSMVHVSSYGIFCN